MKKNTIGMLLFAVAVLCVSPVNGQTVLPETKTQVVMPAVATRLVSSSAQLIKIKVLANTGYTIASVPDWLKVAQNAEGLTVTVSANESSATRRGNIVLAYDVQTNKGATRQKTQSISIAQERYQFDGVTGSNEQVAVSSATTNDYYSGNPISNTIDGNASTYYHSNWTNKKICDADPARLTYNFSGVDRIDRVTYVPQTYNANGRFGRLEVWYKTKENTAFQKYGDFDFGMAATSSTITFAGGLKNPTCIEFRVKDGSGPTITGVNSKGETVTMYVVACAEMQFFKNRTLSTDYDVFADNLYTTLKDGVTGADIDNLTDPLARFLARKIFSGTYSTDYRAGEYKCIISPSELGRRLMIGDGYTKYQNPTGVVINPGRTVVVVEGIPDGKSVSLLVKKWYAMDDGKQAGETYVLSNGINVIEKTTEWRGLGYISYFDNNPEECGNIKVHIVNGEVNGYFEKGMTNAQWDELLANARYEVLDMVGEYAQAVFPVKDLQTYASGKGRWLMAAYDSIVCWEQQYIGLRKYDKMPENRIMARVAFSGYMFRDADGVAFHYNQMYRTCSPEKLTAGDFGVCWGMAHEWGHVHQMNNFLKWGGLTETSNNFNTMDVVMRMGLPDAPTKHASMVVAANNKLLNNTWAGKPGPLRHAAYTKASGSINPELCMAMKDSIITSAETDPDHAISYLELSHEEKLATFWNLFYYMTYVRGMKDFSSDLYEMLRHTPDDDDKYAVLATKQCGNNKANAVPFQLNFVHKVSRLTGYNLYPYFEQYGFFRLVALYYNDYSNYYYLMDRDTRDEFKAYMQNLEDTGVLKPMDRQMIWDIQHVEQKAMPAPDWSMYKD